MSSLNSGLPEYEYPVPVVVRNTFIETQVGRPESLDEFFQERRIVSCPGPQREDFDQDIVPSEPQPLALQRAITTGAQAFMTRVATAAGSWMGPENADINSSQQMPRVLMLSEALPEPELGQQEIPTVGSAGHYIGTCKPCAFLYTKGCENGAQCPFCHLCPPDEKRRRQKDKQAAFREVRRQRRQVRL